MELPYTQTDETVHDTYRRVHANGEQTHVSILSAGERYHVVVAYDVNPADVVPQAAECVAYDPTLEGARERARRWMEQHPKGILGSESGGGTGRKLIDGVVKLGKKLDEHGNQQMEQMQDQQQGGQQ